MKTLFVVISLIIISASMVEAQNYLGMSQSKILKNYGKPDTLAVNYMVYGDENEDGTNTYYFDNSKNCVSFVIVRSLEYFDDYNKMLDRSFVKISKNTYVSKGKSGTLQAEVVKSTNGFQVKISFKDTDSKGLVASNTDIP